MRGGAVRTTVRAAPPIFTAHGRNPPCVPPHWKGETVRARGPGEGR